MNLTALLAAIPVPVLALAISANAIPYLSALVTRKPGWWTGAATFALSLLGAVCAAVAQPGGQDWRYVAAVTTITWVVARLHLNTFVKATAVESWLHTHGPVTPATSTPAASG